MLSAICFNLDQSKILWFGNGLMGYVNVASNEAHMFAPKFYDRCIDLDHITQIFMTMMARAFENLV